MINIIIADDHDVIIEGLSSILKEQDNICIIGSAKNGKEAIELIDKKHIEINVAVIDISMPEIDGIELTKYIKKNYSNIKILILSMHDNIGFIRRTIDAGVHGYILKNKVKEELVRGIESLHRGNDFLGEEITKTLLSSMRSDKVFGEIKFTKREKQVLKFIANGHTSNEIAKQLSIAKTTIETHRRNLIEKTGVKNSKELIKFAIENGYH